MQLLRIRGAGARFMNGALLAFLAGVGISVIPDWLTRTFGLQHSPEPYIPLGTLALSVLLAGVGAWALRSWWAALVIPAVYFAGYLLGALLDFNVVGSAYDPNYFVFGIEVFGFLYLGPLILLALLATALSKWRARRASAPAI